MNEKSNAERLIKAWKGDKYLFDLQILDKVGDVVKKFGDSTLLFSSSSKWAQKFLKTITESLEKNDLSFNIVSGARPNCPREDLYRMALHIQTYQSDSVIAFGGGSTIDGVKAANVLATYHPYEVSNTFNIDWDVASSIEPYFGTGNVTKIKNATGKCTAPVIAIQTASSSAAHLTKYSNITDPIVGQKKLIVDDSITPERAIFDYGVTVDAPKNLTLDGGLDGIAHIWEVFMGSTGKGYYEKIKEIASLGLSLIINNLKHALRNDVNARVALGLGTDLGGYSIMVGGTNGPHLGSFSLVDILSHGRACAILNPYWTIFFSPNIQDQLKILGEIFQKSGYIGDNVNALKGRKLGEIVSQGMLNFNKDLGFPTTLKEVGATENHIIRMLEAAKNPQLTMKLMNMPVPLNPETSDIEKYMKGVLEAAFTGNIELIKTINI